MSDDQKVKIKASPEKERRHIWLSQDAYLSMYNVLQLFRINRFSIKYFVILCLSAVIFMAFLTNPDHLTERVTNYGLNVSSRLFSFVAESLPAAQPETKCDVPKFEDVSTILNYLDQPKLYNCSRMETKGGGYNMLASALKFLDSSFNKDSSASSYVDGQKYICMDPNIGLDPRNCTVYSFGINNEWSFDDDMAAFGCQVYSFDPTMGQQDHQRSERVHFYNLGVGGFTGEKLMQKEVVKMSRFEDILKKLGHLGRKLDYLKIDIEGSELDLFEDIFKTSPGLLANNVVQIAMEIHIVTGNKKANHKKLWRRYWNVLKLLECLGFRLVNNDPNVASGIRYHYKGNNFLCCYELLLLNTNLLVQ